MASNTEFNPILQQALTYLREYYESKLLVGQKITLEDRNQITSILTISNKSFENKSNEFILSGLLKICFDFPNSSKNESNFSQELNVWQNDILNLLKEDESILLENFRESDEVKYGFLLNYCLASGIIYYLESKADQTVVLAAALLTDVVYNSWKNIPALNNKWFDHIHAYLKEFFDLQIQKDWEIPNLITNAESWSSVPKVTPLPKEVEELELSHLFTTTNEILSEIKKSSQAGKKVADNLANIVKYLKYDELQKKLLWWLNVKHSNSYQSPELVSYRQIDPPILAGLYMGLDITNLAETSYLPTPNKVFALLIECFWTLYPQESELQVTWKDIIKQESTEQFIDTHLNVIWKILKPYVPSDSEEENNNLKVINIICEFFKLAQAQHLINEE
ncbi:GTPase-associated system all-helical protein GASH [Acinetobacter bereziniae]|uniref:GTPase-associated system all-helical protein GASH n=1 Tax=Acinetobacter bereziniae TaxID=106648 RepID=UPI0030087304